jgi:hypothetical protein
MNEQTRTPAGVSRRTLLARGAMVGGALWAGSLQSFMARRAMGAATGVSPYGPVAPAFDETTGLPRLQLPAGFRYISYGWTGQLMDDGVPTPALHDGMAVIDTLGRGQDGYGNEESGGDDGRGHGRPGNVDGNGDGPGNAYGHLRRLVLVRNHGVGAGAPFPPNRAITYRETGGGGTTNLIFDARHGRFEAAWSSLAGTIRNCAGGVTPWGTWLTCEETASDPGHGYCFDVGPQFGDPTPLVAMGRFSHEAVAVDYDTGYVYETEDAHDCGFYRFIPNEPGVLARGGRLSMMRIKDQAGADLGVVPVGKTYRVAWVPVNDPAATTTSTYQQGRVQGGARFRRLEGAWTSGDGIIYFLSTDGGTAREGQVFAYNPRSETLVCIYESPGQAECENPDNITVTPRGGLLLCEDNSGATTNDPERMLGLTFDGHVFTFAKNNVVLPDGAMPPIPGGDYRQSEVAGACYSPDGQWLFVNVQTPGITFAITGPWGREPL